MFQQQPNSAPASQAGTGRTAFMMFGHEQKLMHDVVELRDEQITIKRLIDSMQSDITNLISFRNLATSAPPKANGVRLNDPANAGQLVDLVLQGSPKMCQLLAAPINQTGDATEGLGQELNRAFQALNEVTSLKGQLISMQSTGLTGTGPQLDEALGEQVRGLMTFQKEVKAWKMQADLKFDEMRQKLEKLDDELPLIAMKFGRTALRVAQMGKEDRVAALEAMGLKEAEMERQLGRRPPLQPGEKPTKPSSRQTLQEFQNFMMDLGNVDPLAVGETSECGGDRLDSKPISGNVYQSIQESSAVMSARPDIARGGMSLSLGGASPRLFGVSESSAQYVKEFPLYNAPRKLVGRRRDGAERKMMMAL